MVLADHLPSDEAEFPDPYYASRRGSLFLVAVQLYALCLDLLLHLDGNRPSGQFGVRSRAVRAGQDVLDFMTMRDATEAELATETGALDSCAQSIQRRLDTSALPGLFYDNLEHPRWDEVAERCLSCGSCTMVCPTCFCHDERDGICAARRRRPSSSSPAASYGRSAICARRGFALRCTRATGRVRWRVRCLGPRMEGRFAKRAFGAACGVRRWSPPSGATAG